MACLYLNPLHYWVYSCRREFQTKSQASGCLHQSSLWILWPFSHPALSHQWLGSIWEAGCKASFWNLTFSILLELSPLLQLRGSSSAHDRDQWCPIASSFKPLLSHVCAQDFGTWRPRTWHSYSQLPMCFHPCYLGLSKESQRSGEEIQYIRVENTWVVIHEVPPVSTKS